jgi:hypothetical protein
LLEDRAEVGLALLGEFFVLGNLPGFFLQPALQFSRFSSDASLRCLVSARPEERREIFTRRVFLDSTKSRDALFVRPQKFPGSLRGLLLCRRLLQLH